MFRWFYLALGLFLAPLVAQATTIGYSYEGLFDFSLEIDSERLGGVNSTIEYRWSNGTTPAGQWSFDGIAVNSHGIRIRGAFDSHATAWGSSYIRLTLGEGKRIIASTLFYESRSYDVYTHQWQQGSLGRDSFWRFFDDSFVSHTGGTWVRNVGYSPVPLPSSGLALILGLALCGMAAVPMRRGHGAAGRVAAAG